MLFNSYEFLLVFLPIVLTVVLGATSLGRPRLAKLLLLVASLVFYAWWDPPYVALLLAVLAFNFTVGSWLIRTVDDVALGRRRLVVLVFGLVVNIGALVYFKYTNFLATELGRWFHVDFALAEIVLPLGISFIVFQKIAFLVDAHGGQIKRLGLLDYGLFVSFFPQLISGPIVHHREMIPQFAATGLRYIRRGVPIAISFLVIGAFKKVVIADHFSSHVAIAFHTTAAGQHHDLIAAWMGALAFTLQVYFDFSGYSDMAIGLGLLFGVRLPFNFNSPLKAASIIDFWRRWHISLTRFLTAYIYNPIVLRRTRRRVAKGKRVMTKGVMGPRAFFDVLVIPTMITMVIAGAWHGAGFQYVAFGAIHGAYLVIDYGWRNFRGPKYVRPVPGRTAWVPRALTLVAVVASIPFFRAASVHDATGYLASMVGAHGAVHVSPLADKSFVLLLAVAFLASQILPNTQELMAEQLDAVFAPLAKHAGDARPSDAWSWPRVTWRPTVVNAVLIGLMAWVVLLLLAAPSEFLYFQF